MADDLCYQNRNSGHIISAISEVLAIFDKYYMVYRTSITSAGTIFALYHGIGQYLYT